MPDVDLDEELYEKIQDWILANNIDMTVDEVVNEIIHMMFEEDGLLSD